MTDLGSEVGCAHGRGLTTNSTAAYSPNAVAISADGKTVYVATVRGNSRALGTISTFSLGSNGTLTQLPGRFGVWPRRRGMRLGARHVRIGRGRCESGRPQRVCGRLWENSIVALTRTRP